MASSPKLENYRAKRDFKKTAEPSGKNLVLATEQRRFVIQKHAARRLHYDLRLEVDGVFKSWAVTRGPSLDPHDKRLAVEVEDHPLDYGDFEGTIPRGQYGGGTVQLWDRGFWMPEDDHNPGEALAKGELKFVLAGGRLQGGWVLVRMKHDRAGGKRTNWLLIKHRDSYALDHDGAEAVLAEEASIASGRSLEKMPYGKAIKAKPLRRTQNAQNCFHSLSRRSYANLSIGRRQLPAGAMRSNSTATGYSFAYRPGKPRLKRVKA
jgi:bifunctional non-homologous end joining protein LigD